MTIYSETCQHPTCATKRFRPGKFCLKHLEDYKAPEHLDSTELLILLTIFSKQGTVEENASLLRLLSLGLVNQPETNNYIVTVKGQKHLLKLLNTEVI